MPTCSAELEGQLIILCLEMAYSLLQDSTKPGHSGLWTGPDHGLDSGLNNGLDI